MTVLAEGSRSGWRRDTFSVVAGHFGGGSEFGGGGCNDEWSVRPGAGWLTTLESGSVGYPDVAGNE